MLAPISIQSLALVGLALPLLTSALPRAIPDAQANAKSILQSNPSAISFNALFQPVVNPGFEDPTDNAQNQIAPWSAGGNVQLNQQASNARNGTNSLILDGKNGKLDTCDRYSPLDQVVRLRAGQCSHSITFSLKQTVSVLPGFQYTFKFASRVIGGRCGLDTCFDGPCTYAIDLTDDWQVFSRTWTAPGEKPKFEPGKGGQPLSLTGSAAELEKNLEGKMVKILLGIFPSRICNSANVLIDNVTLELVKDQGLGS